MERRNLSGLSEQQRRHLQTYEEQVTLRYTLHDKFVPAPKIGFQENWRERHAHLANCWADHRACPAIMTRESFGLTLHMPFTATFFPDGRLSVTNVEGDTDERVYRFVVQPAEAYRFASRYTPPTDPKMMQVPRKSVEIPGGRRRMFNEGLFALGDIRLHVWIVESGITLHEVPAGLKALIVPLPNHVYQPGVSVGQAFMPTTWHNAGHVKIPIDIDFRQTKDEPITIRRGVPLVQYLFVRLPDVTLEEMKVDQAPVELSTKSQVKVNVAWAKMVESFRADPAKKALVIPHADLEVEVEMGAKDSALLRRMKDGETVAELATRLELPLEDTLATAGRLARLGVLEAEMDVDPNLKDLKLPQFADAYTRCAIHGFPDVWEEAYEIGVYMGWTHSGPSPELKKLVPGLMARHRPGIKVLDVGSGLGHDAIFLAQHQFDVTAFEIAPLAAKLCKENAEKAQVPLNVRAEDVTQASYDGGAALCTDRFCFQQLSGPQQAAYAKAMANWIQPGGLLYLRGLKDPRRARRPIVNMAMLDPALIEKLFGESFEVGRISDFDYQTDLEMRPGVEILLWRKGAPRLWPEL